MFTPLGAHSPKLDGLRALRTKEGRLLQGRYAVEGPTMLAEALAAGQSPEAVYATEAGLTRLGPVAGRLAGRLFSIPPRAMERVSDLESPPGILAVFPQVSTSLDDLLATGEPAIVLAGVADPGNAGTLLRTAEIFGIGRAVFGRGSVEAHNPKVVRATMGAIFRMQLATADGPELAAAAAKYGYLLVAAARAGIPLPEARFPKAVLIAIGNERHGLGGWLPRWDLEIAIPQAGKGQSLNAAVAGGIILYAFSQQARGMNEEPHGV